MPTHDEFYQGTYGNNITDHGVYKNCRLWSSDLTCRIEFTINERTITLSSHRHRPAHFTDLKPHYSIKACIVSENGDYLATCGQHNDWLVWRLSDQKMIEGFTSKDFYPPRTIGSFIFLGALACISLTARETGETIQVFEKILKD